MTAAAIPLVGRKELLVTVSNALVDADCGGVVLLGAAGVGKTRVAEECMTLGDQCGFATARVRGTRAGSSIPFGAVSPLLPATEEVSADRAEALRRAVHALAAHGDGRPLLLAVDDAHLLDDASATLVQQVTATGAAFVVATVRTGEPCPDPITALWKDGLALRLDVEGLTEPNHDQFLDAVVGGQVDAASRRRVYAASRGNPLLTRELVQAARDSGSLVMEGGVWRVGRGAIASPRLAELVGVRIGSLDDEEQRALELVVLGDPLGVALLDALGLGPAVERLERRDLLRVGLDGRRLEATAAHPLYGDVARARIPALRARNLRRTLAEAVEATGARRREDALRTATWRLDAGLPAPAELALTAARQARAAFDLPLATRLAHAALEAGAGVAAALVVGESCYQQGLGDEAEAVLAAAAEMAADDTELAMVTMVRADNLFWALERTEEAVALVDRVIDAVEDPLWRDVLTMVVAGQRINFTGDVVGALAAVEPIRAHPVPMVAVGAAMLAEACLLEVGRHDEAVALCRETRPIHEALGPVPLLFEPELHTALEVLSLVEAGHLGEAASIAEPAYAHTVEHGPDRGRAWLATMLGRLRLRQGDIAGALALAREAIPLFRTAGQASMARLAAATLVEAAARAGDDDVVADAVATLDALAGQGMGVYAGEISRARAAVVMAGGDREQAVELLRSGIAHATGTGEATVELLCRRDLAALGEVGADDVERLAALRTAYQGPLAGIVADHAAAVAAGDIAGLTTVADRYQAIGTLPWAATALLQAAGAAERAGDDRAASAARRRTAALLARCPGWRSRHDGSGDVDSPSGVAVTLSDREREVAELAAAGRSDREIADVLFLSTRTVGNHLLRAYRKLGIRARDELASALTEVPPTSPS